MTMLDRMRRHRNWLKWSLALVVLTFVVFYIPDFLSVNGTGTVGADSVAEVDGRPITSAEFFRVYNNQLQQYRNAYGGSMNEALLKQLGIDRLYAVGQFAGEVVASARAAGMEASSLHASRDWEETARLVLEQLGEGDRVLVKGSRSMRMERIVQHVRREAGAGEND